MAFHSIGPKDLIYFCIVFKNPGDNYVTLCPSGGAGASSLSGGEWMW